MALVCLLIGCVFLLLESIDGEYRTLATAIRKRFVNKITNN